MGNTHSINVKNQSKLNYHTSHVLAEACLLLDIDVV